MCTPAIADPVSSINGKLLASSKAKLSKTIKKLTKKKVYAVRLRAYNVVEGHTIYGAWSKVKSGKVV